MNRTSEQGVGQAMSSAALLQNLGRWPGSHASECDADLLTRFVNARDEAAFAALVRRHAALVYGTCQRILGNRADADDAFQAVFFVLARRAHTLKFDRNIGSWLYVVARRVANKLRGQIVQRRLRDMSAAKSECTEAVQPEHGFWAVVDDELARLPAPLREVVLLCDLDGQSHAQAAESLRLAKGTITKRLAKAHQLLAVRLNQRGVTLGAAAAATLLSSQAGASIPAALLMLTTRSAIAFSVGSVGESSVAHSLAEGVMRSMKSGVLKVWLFAGLLASTLAGSGYMLAAGHDVPPSPASAEPPKAEGKTSAVKPGLMWKETFTVEYPPNALPVSVMFSADGQTLLSGDASGEVTALIFPGDEAQYRWKTSVGGSHAAVAYSADQKKVYATTEDGVCILDAARGKEQARITVKDSNPIALGVFPNQVIDESFTRSQIVFGNARGYMVKSWADGMLESTIGTIETSTVAAGAKPADALAVPLAADPKGRSAIMTGPRDASGRNVLWAYVCGNYDKGSPGNRVLKGHTAAVVSAAWAKEGSRAVTGDAAGRVIVWDAKSMTEARPRLELGGRVLALAISDDGARIAACVRGKLGCDVYVWDAADAASSLKLIHTELGDFSVEPFASLAFSPDGKRLAGCAVDKNKASPKLKGKVRVWEFAAEPAAQAPPRHAYSKPLTRGGRASFAFLDNHSMLVTAPEEGAVDFVRAADGGIQMRLVLGKFALGRMKLSTDRDWLAIESRPKANNPGETSETFNVGVYEATMVLKGTIPACSQTLDIASGGKGVAVVRDKKIEIWDVAAAKVLKSAPFQPTRIDAAQFSPYGKRLAISDSNQLVLWTWEDNTVERLDLGRRVGSLAFSPDGRFLAEGPTPGETIRIRDLETRKIVRELANTAKSAMNVRRLVFAQGGRVLIACDNAPARETASPHRITIWDTATGTVAHQIAAPAGLREDLDLSPNGRTLAAWIDDGASGKKLEVWRMDGESATKEAAPAPPASSPPR